jgi:hypothetical protein
LTIVAYAEAELLRSKWDSQKELEAERAALIGELEKSAVEGKAAEEKKVGEARAAVFAELPQESLSPELARQLETAIDRRSTLASVGPDGPANADSDVARASGP